MAKQTINVEGGEVLQTPDGQSHNINGPSHEQGGINMQVPFDSVIFSDRIFLKGKSLADRKKKRDKLLDKLSEKSKKGDYIANNAYLRTAEKADKEEMGDVLLQTLVRNKIEGRQSGIPKAALGAGDYLGLATNIIGPLATLGRTKKAAKDLSISMPNFNQNYGINGINNLRSAIDDIDMTKASTLNKVKSQLDQEQQTASAQISTSGSLNLQRALRTASKVSSDKAYADAITDVENNSTNSKLNIKSRISDMLNDRDARVAEGAKESFLFNYDQARTNAADELAAENALITGFQSIGSALNNDQRNTMMQDQLGTLAGAYGMQFDPKTGKTTPVKTFAYGGKVGSRPSSKIVFNNDNDSSMKLPKIDIPDPFKFVKNLLGLEEKQTKKKEEQTQGIINTNPVTTGTSSSNNILGLIAKGESGGNYNAVSNSKPSSLTGLTLSEASNYAKSNGRHIGKYQFGHSEILDHAKNLGLDPNKTKFDSKTQELLAEDMLNRNGYNDFKAGKINRDQFLHKLSKKWAALPKDKSGVSYYTGIGTNAANIKYNDFINLFPQG